MKSFDSAGEGWEVRHYNITRRVNSETGKRFLRECRTRKYLFFKVIPSKDAIKLLLLLLKNKNSGNWAVVGRTTG